MPIETHKEKRRGCNKRSLFIVLSILLLCTLLQWWSTRPSHMAKRYLSITVATKLDVVKADTGHIFSIDPTAHIYLEAEKNVIRSIIHNNEFVLQDGYALEDRLKWLNFPGAPTAEGTNLILYEKRAGNPIEYLVTNPENTKIWYVAAHY
jgi:hypothetical protein